MKCTGTDRVQSVILGTLFDRDIPCCSVADLGQPLCYRHRYLAENRRKDEANVQTESNSGVPPRTERHGAELVGKR